MLTLRDCAGGEVRAFVSRDTFLEPPVTGAVVELIGEVSEDDQTFVFIKTLKIVTQPQASSSSDGKS